MKQKPREGKNLNNKSFMLKTADVQHGWIILDANGKTLGRFATEITKVLRGKHKPTYTPHIDCGDGVIVINADKIQVTGNKAAQKVYRKYTGFMGGMREIPYRTLMQQKPEYIIERAVTGMMPKSRLGGQQIRRLRIVAGEDHNLTAQKPIKANV